MRRRKALAFTISNKGGLRRTEVENGSLERQGGANHKGRACFVYRREGPSYSSTHDIARET